MRRVYFIKPIGMDGPIKIGCSRSPERRHSALENWSPFPLEIVASIEGDFHLERRFHAKFAHLHDRREWFFAGDDLAQTIEAINNGTFDVSSLPNGINIGAGKKPPKPEWFALQMSYSLRVAWMTRRTGTQCPVCPYDMIRKNDVERIAAVEAYLADPIGRGIHNPWPWAVKAREHFMATYRPEQVSAH